MSIPAELFVGGDVLRAGIFFTHFHRHWDYLCVGWCFVCVAFLGGRFLLFCVVFCLVCWFSRFMNMGCTSTSSFPRLSPSSR